MKYEDYESKINESVKNPDEASVNLLEVLSELKEDLANRLRKELKKNNGKIKIPYSTYRKYLKDAASTSNQDFNGTHGLRFNYVQKEYHERINEFKNHNEALKEISYNIGHHREEITEHYRRPSDNST